MRDLTELKEERFITYDPSCQIRSYINDIFHEVGIWPEISFEAKHDSIVLGAVVACFRFGGEEQEKGGEA